MGDFSVPSGIKSLNESIKQKNPALYQIIDALIGRVDSLNNQLNPPVASNRVISNPTIVPDDVTSFTYALTQDFVFLNWSAVDTAQTYEIRKGSSWNTALYVTNLNGLQAVLEPLVVGDTTFLIKAINAGGLESTNALSLVVTVPVIDAPAVVGTSILNTAILNYTPPDSAFRIDHYIIYRSAVELTTFNGTFFTYQESAAGTYSYGVAAVDIAGNVGATQTISITVTAPSDFILQSILSSTFAGTKTNAFLDTTRNVLEVCLNLVETYANHFITNGWATPQDQINAGYPIYGEPGQATATYVEKFDFGSIFTNVVIGISWSFTLIDGTVSIATQLEFSNDDIVYTAPVAGPTAFASSARYVRVTVNFTGGLTDILEFFNFQCAMSVHRENDGGSGTANAGDAGGTVFTFNKAFVAVESVTATPSTTSSFKAVVTAITTTQFKVLVFNDAGVRQTATLEWKARGIL
jgi:hypothetical protein